MDARRRTPHPAAILACLTLLAAPGAADAEVYRWTDARGQLHFTERIEQVPPEQRAQARRDASRRTGPSPVQTFESSLPPPPAARGPRSNRPVQIPFERQGSLMRVDAEVNDALTVPFFVDTGASGVSLPRGVVERLGIRIDASTPTVMVSTANGVVSRPVVRLESVQLGGARVENLMAVVNPSMQVGLLGGAFFNNFVYRVDAATAMISLTTNDGIRGGHDEDEWREIFRRLREPLAELDDYLATKDVTRQGQREALERRRAELREQLATLEVEATRAGVPAAWRR